MADTPSSPGQGGTPSSLWLIRGTQGYPHLDLGWGIPPYHWMDVPPIWTWDGIDLRWCTPLSRPRIVYPHPVLGWGTPHPYLGCGTFFKDLGWSTPHPDWDGVHPAMVDKVKTLPSVILRMWGGIRVYPNRAKATSLSFSLWYGFPGLEPYNSSNLFHFHFCIHSDRSKSDWKSDVKFSFSPLLGVGTP